MLGFIIASWAAPTMTASRLLFAGVATAYIFVGILLEERDHVKCLGGQYQTCKAGASMIIPMPPKQ
jgi:protein-S-isoprenylcysteine O-methyltransferase Ste14